MATRVIALFEPRLPIDTAVSYSAGAIVNGEQLDVNTATVHSGHGIVTGDKFLYAISDGNIYFDRVFTAGTITATTVPFTGDVFSFPDEAILVPLGTDTGGTVRADGSFTLPNYDGSTITMTSDGNGDDTIANITVSPEGDASHWVNTVPVWVLGIDMGLKPVSVLIDIGISAAGAGISLTRGTSFPVAPTLGDEHVLVTAGSNPDIKYIYMKLSDTTSDWVEVVCAP